MAIIYFTAISELLPPKMVFMMSFISSSSPSRLKGQIKTFLVIYTLTNVFDMYTQSLLDMSNVVMDNPILSSGKKILTQFGHAS